MRASLTTIAIIGLLSIVLACGNNANSSVADQEGEDAMAEFTLTSSAFADGEPVPQRFTCDSEDVSPPLSWENVPEDAASFALIVEDPDAPSGTFDHWTLYNLPADARKLEEGVPTKRALENGALQGTNDFGQIGYRGPCPPAGPAHRYVFTLKALDTTLDVDPGLTKQALLDAIDGQADVLGEATLTGKYAR